MRLLPVPTSAQLRGEQLYDDDFTPEQVEQWFRDEAEAYFEMSGDSQAVVLACQTGLAAAHSRTGD